MMEEPRDVVVPVDGVELQGTLGLPPHPTGVVVFAHGSGSSHLTCRNRYVAEVFNEAGLATLLLDLLTLREYVIDQYTRDFRFDVPRQSMRLQGAIDWLGYRRDTALLPIGLYGAGVGAAVALVAAARRPELICANVARGGRLETASSSLPQVRAPSLLLVGGLDREGLAQNRQAAATLRCEHRLVVIPGARRLFDEPYKLTEVARLAGDWFTRHFEAVAVRPGPQAPVSERHH